MSIERVMGGFTGFDIECNTCGQTHSFSYSCDWNPVIVHTLAMRRDLDREKDLCPACKAVMEKGFFQPRLC